MKHKSYSTLNLLTPFRGLFTNLTIDFITDILLCKYQGTVYDSIFLILCQYTEMAQYIAAQINCTIEWLAQAFLEHI